MGQEPKFTMPAGLDELREILEDQWSAKVAELHASGVPLSLYEDLTDEQLTAKSAELGVQIADGADRAAIVAALNAHKPAPAPPWGDDTNFDPERAWKLITDTRADRDKIKTERDQLRTRVQEHEDATKTEQERATERAAEAERLASSATLEAARLRVALKKGLTELQAKRLVGETEEELEQDADDLLASFQTEDDRQEPDPLRPRPRERLRPGAAPSAEPEVTDPAKLADLVPRRY